MIEDLQKNLLSFIESDKVKNERADYASIYNMFYEYIYSEWNHKVNYSFKDFFSSLFTRREVINACRYYFENVESVKSESAIDKALNAMTYMYHHLLKPLGVTNYNLEKEMPFSNFKCEVVQSIENKKINKVSSNPPITLDIYKKIIMCLDESKASSFTKSSINAVFKLTMRYGFKMNRINSFKIGDFSNGKLNVCIDNEQVISLELPSDLRNDLHYFVNSRVNQVKNMYDSFIDTDTFQLFTWKNGDAISAAFYTYGFKPIVNLIEKKDMKRLTSTGLAKFAIMNMLAVNMDTYVIRQLTGNNMILIEDCIKLNDRYNNKQGLDSYINYHTGPAQNHYYKLIE